MSERIFYVGSEDKHGRRNGFVAAKFLTLNGKPVVDPTLGGSQNANIYSDGLGRNQTIGGIANPSNYLIVHANYTEQQARDFAAGIANTMGQASPGDETGTRGLHQALGQMAGAFVQGGSQDLQRHPQWGIPKDSFVRAFTGSASYHLGSVTRWAGLPVEWSEVGGGIPNWINAHVKEALNPPVPRLGIYPKKIDANGPHGLSWHNYDNIVKGFADADTARNGPSLTDNFGYNPQTQYPAGQIGDGNGLGVGDWRFALAGVDPMNPMQPMPPPQTGEKLVRKLVRVSGNTSPASPALPVAPSDDRSSFGDRFGRWGSSPAGIAPLPPSDRPESFDNRFGSWGSVPTGGFGETRSPVLRALEKYRRSAAPDGAVSTSAQAAPQATPALQPDIAGNGAVRILGKFVGNNPITPAAAASPSGPLLTGLIPPNLPREQSGFRDRSENAPGAPSPDPYPRLRRVSSAFPDAPPRNPDQPVPPPERGPPLGIFSGKPMSQWFLPPSVWGLPDIPMRPATATGSIFWQVSPPGIRRSLRRRHRTTDCATSTAMTRRGRGPFNVRARRGSLPPPDGAAPSSIKFDTSGKSPAYLYRRKKFKARAGKLAAGFLNRTAAAFAAPHFLTRCRPSLISLHERTLRRACAAMDCRPRCGGR
jgi:hypothetical protein